MPPDGAALAAPSLPVPLVCLIGPTGVGKTAAALHLARAFDGVVINLDSRQVYADFPLVTAQPLPEERAVCQHFLYGFLGTRETISAGKFAEMAARIAKSRWATGKLPLIVGGTGLYLRALLHGLAAIPPIPDGIRQHFKQALASRGPEPLHAQLQTVDPATAARLAPRDSQRIARALEVHATTGKALSWWHANVPPTPPHPVRPLLFLLDQPNEVLHPRLRLRIDRMLEMGALKEIDRAWARCPDERAPGFSGIGCPELLANHLGRLQLEDAITLWDQHTRTYVKRQRTWFKKEQEAIPVGPEDLAKMEAETRDFLQEFRCAYTPG